MKTHTILKEPARSLAALSDEDVSAVDVRLGSDSDISPDSWRIRAVRRTGDG